MTKTPNLTDAYALGSDDDVRALYKTWSHSYDSAFSEAQGYQLPREVALAYLSAGGAGPVLDVGAGTGLVGAALHAFNVAPIDGVDLSQEMLDVARMKNHYRSLTVADITKPLSLLDAPYRGIVSAGTFTLGHVGPEALRNLLDIARTGALFAITVNAQHYARSGFAAAMQAFATEISPITMQDVRIYDDRADEGHRQDIAHILTFTKTA